MKMKVAKLFEFACYLELLSLDLKKACPGDWSIATYASVSWEMLNTVGTTF